MGTPTLPPPTTFIIRIWLEPGAAGGSRRGYVEELATRERRYFSTIAEAAEFIAVLGAVPFGRRRDL